MLNNTESTEKNNEGYCKICTKSIKDHSIEELVLCMLELPSSY